MRAHTGIEAISPAPDSVTSKARLAASERAPRPDRVSMARFAVDCGTVTTAGRPRSRPAARLLPDMRLSASSRGGLERTTAGGDRFEEREVLRDLLAAIECHACRPRAGAARPRRCRVEVQLENPVREPARV